MSNFLKGMSMPMPRRAQLARVAVAASVAVGCGVALHSTRRSCRPSGSPQQTQKFYLPQPVVDAICGAVGEVSQIVLLYPLETIKVRCQADGISAAAVISSMTRNGWGPQFVQQLYSGLGSAAAFSVVVGAIHWLTFCAAKRAALDVMIKQEQQGGGGRAAATGGSGAAAAASNLVHVQHTSAGDMAHVHVSSGHHMHDEEVALRAGSAGAGAAGLTDGSGGGGNEATRAADGSDVRMLASANMVGATVGAAARRGERARAVGAPPVSCVPCVSFLLRAFGRPAVPPLFGGLDVGPSAQARTHVCAPHPRTLSCKDSMRPSLPPARPASSGGLQRPTALS
ncbi:hypothetical protein PLESTM_001808700 [Pleodorina starrii]|nr:hypothetical protein PLESTM_001808700 [Pleodorina starrii]